MAKAKRSSSLLDTAMAALAAASVAFVVFAMPDPHFNSAVAMSGLPMLLDAAQPPLGNTARLAVLLTAATATFALVWLVLRALGKKPAAPRRPSQIVDMEVPLPKLRRADAHPDAPARRPILAGLDLGEPTDPADPMEALETPVAAESEADPVRHEEEARQEAPYEDLLDERAEEQPLELGVETLADRFPAAAEIEQTSIEHLMQRLELGLLRREGSAWLEEADEPVRSPEPSRADERLRSAIADLQKLAARGG